MTKLAYQLKSLALVSTLSLTAAQAQAGDWLIGTGIYDITGPAADRGMVGYGDTGQTTKGIHTRLWSRAFTFGTPEGDDFAVFVSADLQSITQGIHQGVMDKIAADARLSPYLSERNVMLSATHTHVGPGGYDHNVMLNMSALGYDHKNYQTIVDGIYTSILRAFQQRTPGQIQLASEDLDGVSINRNPYVYAANPDAGQYSDNVNKKMTLLKLVADSGEELGMLNWFAVHNVSSPQSYRYISGDNKGVASQLFEKHKGSQPPLTTSFVAAFANSDEGDVSPNICGVMNGCADGAEANTFLAATKQYQHALSLYNNASDSLNGTLDYRFEYVRLPGYQLVANRSSNGDSEICEGTIGWSMTAGAGWDGPSNIEGIKEGMTQDNEGSYWNENQTLFGNVFAGYPLLGLMDALSNATNLFGAAGDKQHHACQYPKPTFLNTKLSDDIHLYTDTLPFQLIRLGKLLIVGVPGEMTTMSGRRLREELAEVMGPQGVEQIVIAGLANAYGGYITTPEEYALQYYEGGHTVYGPNTLAAYQQIFTRQAQSMSNNSQLDLGPMPKDWSNKQLISTLGVVYDDKRLWESFGQTWNDASASYFVGETVVAKFRSGHPQNNYKTMDSFLKVQRKENGNWVTLVTENDISARFRWIRDTAADCLACSFVQLEWTIGDDVPSGTYRLKHDGVWKNGFGGGLNNYSGKSREFQVYAGAQVSNVALLSAHGKYLSAVNNGGSSAKADANGIGSSERFSLIPLNGDTCIRHGDKVALRTENGAFFKAEPIEKKTVWSGWWFKEVETGGGLNANASVLSGWESFTLINHSDSQGCLDNKDKVSLKSAHGRYVVAENNGDANANRTSIGSWETFTLVR